MRTVDLRPFGMIGTSSPNGQWCQPTSPEGATPGMHRHLGWRAVLPELRQRGVQFTAGADAELGVYLAQVPFDCAG